MTLYKLTHFHCAHDKQKQLEQLASIDQNLSAQLARLDQNILESTNRIRRLTKKLQHRHIEDQDHYD